MFNLFARLELHPLSVTEAVPSHCPLWTSALAHVNLLEQKKKKKS